MTAPGAATSFSLGAGVGLGPTSGPPSSGAGVPQGISVGCLIGAFFWNCIRENCTQGSISAGMPEAPGSPDSCPDLSRDSPGRLPFKISFIQGRTEPGMPCMGSNTKPTLPVMASPMREEPGAKTMPIPGTKTGTWELFRLVWASVSLAAPNSSSNGVGQ